MVEPIALRQLTLVSFQLFIHQIKVGENKALIRNSGLFSRVRSILSRDAGLTTYNLQLLARRSFYRFQCFCLQFVFSRLLVFSFFFQPS